MGISSVQLKTGEIVPYEEIPSGATWYPYSYESDYESDPWSWDRVKEVAKLYGIGTIEGLKQQWDVAKRMTGGEPVTEDEIIGLADTVAGLPFGTGAARSIVSPRGGFNPNRANMFVPEAMARPTEKLLKKQADTLDAAGVPMSEIWERTGWFKPKSGGPWRTEVDDRGALLTGSGGPYKSSVVHSNLLSRPDNEIFDYIDVKVDPKTTSGGDFLGYWDKLNREIGYNSNTPAELGGPLGTFLHESQHAVQNKYGFRPGSSPREFIPGLSRINTAGADVSDALRKRGMTMSDMTPGQYEGMRFMYDIAGDAPILKNTAERLYRNATGELEAEDVVNRMRMTTNERRKTPPALLEQRGLSHLETGPDDILRYELDRRPEYKAPLKDLADSGLLDDDFMQNYMSLLF